MRAEIASPAFDADEPLVDADGDGDSDGGGGGGGGGAGDSAGDGGRAARAAEAARLFGDLGAVDVGLDAHLMPDGSPRIVERRFEVGDEHAGHRIDHYLKCMIPRLSRTRVQAIVRSQLHREGAPRALKPHSPVAAGEVYVIRRTARPEPPCPRTFTVLHEDEVVVVIDKPAGLPVHASAKFYFNTLTRVLAERFPGQTLQICHRLDRETSGALVVARDAASAAVVKGAFASKRVQKTYLAIVHGQPPWPDEPAGAIGLAEAPTTSIDLPLRVSTDHDDTRLPGVRMVVAPDGLPSTTRVRVVRRVGDVALVRCFPVTGRQHQIRAHLAAAGFPIVGDKLYTHGDEAFMRYCDRGLTPELAARFVLPRQALHAASVRFPHPGKTEPLQIDSPLAVDLDRFLTRFSNAMK
jgi:23S rRNA pseudouridine1911/1915/1917 synthase